MKDIETRFKELCQNANLVGASSVIIKDNKIDKIMNYGYYDKENKKEMTENTIIRIASVSKLEVALCVMMLEEKGLIDLDEDISTYLGFIVRNPKYPDNKITIRMIMTQTSSISDGLEIYYDDKENVFSGYNYILENGLRVDIEELLQENGKYYKDSFNEYQPGTHFEYSNFGCGTLACILERVSGEFFFDFFKENVSNKLNIKASFMASDFKDEIVSSSYTGSGKLNRTGQSFIDRSITKRALGQNYVGPAGGLFISMKDLSTFLLAYMNDGKGLVKKETMDKMLEMNWYGDRCGDYTAKGLQFQILDIFDNVRLYGHFGTAYGIKTFLFFNPHQKIGIVFATSGGGFKMMNNDISDVQYYLLEKFVGDYWNYDLQSDVYFTPGDDYLIHDGRRVNVEYKTEKDKINPKRPYIDIMSMLDAFGFSTYIGKTEIDKKYEKSHLFDFVYDIKNAYEYNCEIKEEYKNKDFLHPLKYHYHIYYKLKDANQKKELKFNYHTHCNYCDHADGTVMDYMDMAYKLGYECLGMSDHGPLPDFYRHPKNEDKTAFLHGRMDFEKMVNEYVKDINEAKKKYEGKMKVLASIEIEYFEGMEEYLKKCLDNLDYLVMGEHYNIASGEVVDTYSNCNYKNVIPYAKVMAKGLDTGLFKVVAHPDIFMFRYVSENGIYREFDKNASIAARIIIEAAVRNNVLIELNCGGLSRGKCINEDGSIEYGYPRSEFFNIVKEYKDAKVVIGIDAHSPYALQGRHIEKTIALAKELGLNPINIK